jgi:RimJ/RimL family protein N-acetyltransferase
MANPYWPLFDLVISTPRVELRCPTDEDLVHLAELAARGVHDPSWTPFLKDWASAPSPERERGVLQWGWRHRARWSPESWTLNTVVRHDGRIVGVQDLSADNFAELRTVKSGSWLGYEFQGHGIGTEMRSAIVPFAFEGLGALLAKTGAFADNAASRGVSTAVGYEFVGDDFALRRGLRATHANYVLTRDRWLERRRNDITIAGLDACLEFFGVD